MDTVDLSFGEAINTAHWTEHATIWWTDVVSEPPVVISGLENCEVSDQGPAKFCAKITGVPPPAVTW